MFKTYLEALTDVGKAKMNILDKSSLLNRKKNWAKVGYDKPDNPLRLIVNPSPKQLENYGWLVPEWSKSDEYKPGERIGFVRGIIYYDEFVKKVVLTIADTTGGNNDIIHDDILDELVRLGRLIPDEDRSNSYDEQTNTFIVVIQNAKLPEFDLSESYLSGIEGNDELESLINDYYEDGGQYRINNYQSQVNTSRLMTDADIWEKSDTEMITDNIIAYINRKENNILDYLISIHPQAEDSSPEQKEEVNNTRWEELINVLYKQFSDGLAGAEMESAIYDAFYTIEHENKDPQMAKKFADFKYGKEDE